MKIDGRHIYQKKFIINENFEISLVPNIKIVIKRKSLSYFTVFHYFTKC